VTPPLGKGDFTFPVVGPVGYADTYGARRNDVSGKWHHGDDIFAPLGAPVVAVASGTINRVGWERVGGWRLWVRDSAADEFYYAHLSGYTRSVFHSKRVRAGQVIGFVGNTGDAFGGAPHLHFEVHPHQLLRLGYDGAVDPTMYLDAWKHLERVQAPLAVHPRLPEQPQLRYEAEHVFRQLLVVQQVSEARANASARFAPPASTDRSPGVPSGTFGHVVPAIELRGQGSFPTAFVVLFAGLAPLALLGTVFLHRRLRG
jgi:hypothetical protein